MDKTTGTLTQDQLGFSMPGHAPLFPAPPYEYQDASLLVFKYHTDPTSAARMLPARAALVHDPKAPGKAVAGLVFARYPASTLGPYLEVVQFLYCLYGQQLVQFATHLYVTTDVAMAAGREMGGYPKKIADIRIDGAAGTGFSATLDRPTGQALVTATLTGLGAPVPVAAGEALLQYLTLRIVPSPIHEAPPSLSQLIVSDWQILDGLEQTGIGSCTITGTSTLDPLHFAPVHDVFEAKFVHARALRVAANDPDPRMQPF